MPAVLSKFLDTHYGVLVPKTLPEVVHMMLHSGVERGTTVPDATYTMIRRDIMALPVDRRGKFRSTLRDQWGQKTKLWYDPDTDTLWNYSIAVRAYVPVILHSEMRSSALGYESKTTDMSLCGRLTSAGVDNAVDIVAQLNRTNNHVARSERRTIRAVNPYGHQ